MFRRFIFATGIENSIPTINHGRTRMDEMESAAIIVTGKPISIWCRSWGRRAALRAAAAHHLAGTGPL